MNYKGIAAVVGMALAVSVPALSAQGPMRTGAWAGLGIGGSSARLTCQVCSGDRETAVSGYVQVGGTISSQVRFGLESGIWWRDESQLQQWIASLGLVGYFYPQRTGGLFFKAGPTGLYYKASDDDEDEVTSRFYGVLVGMGYELPSAGSFVISPALTIHASSFGRLASDDETVSRDVNLSLIQLTIGITSR